MLKRTHLAIGVAATLYFLPLVEYKSIFIPIVLISSLLPDIDSVSSQVGRKMIFMPLHWFFTHRGFFHSYTFCIIASCVIALVYPIAAFPFFLGYSFHLLADSFTVNGIRPFWPSKALSAGFVTTGSKVDETIFVSFIIIDFLLFILLFV